MKLKKSVKRKLFVIIALIIIVIVGAVVILNLPKDNKEKDVEVKVVNQVEKYGYELKETKSKRYKEMFKELKEILSEEKVDEEKYVSKLTEMFIYDFYTLDDKSAKTDIGGVDFVYKDVLSNFLINAQDTYYKYVESDIYNNRNQQLPIVDTVTVDAILQQPYAYGTMNDDKAYVIKASWTYTKTEFSSYQNQAQLVFIHDGEKLSLVELK